MKKLVTIVVAIALTLGCDQGGSGGGTSTKPAASSAGSGKPAASAAPAKPKEPWFVGKWEGTYEARHYLIEMTKKQGKVRAWEQDDGGKASGKGKISVTIAKDGMAEGETTGPLGKLEAVGKLEESSLRLRLRVVPPIADGGKIFNGFILLDRVAGKDEFKGTLQASSGDSLTVRDAPVVLKKGGGAGAKPGAAPAGSAKP